MTRVSSHIANIALAIGVAAAMGIAVAITLTHADHRAKPSRITVGQRPNGGSAPEASLARQPAASGFSVAALRPGPAAEPFEPPPPPMNAAAVPASRPGAAEQVAALTPPEAALPLRSVDLEDHAIHAVPRHDQSPRRVTSVTREETAPPVEHAPSRLAAAPRREPKSDNLADAEDDADEADGVKLAGPAIVTGPLELNIAGRPLQLYGVKPPTGNDLCSPGRDYAARSCLDVSRQALEARIGPDGAVTCRILAVGGRSTLPAVCTDRTGTDLATYLVAHGLALADSNEIVDYSGAETQAKNARSGLWSYR